MKFINRIEELQKLAQNPYPLTVLFGRRRVGKSALIQEHQRQHKTASISHYSQAIEGPESLQIAQLCQDIAPLLPDVEVTSWVDFFKLLRTVAEPCTLVLDEFPYLVKTQPSLPSIMQKFLDHQRPPTLRLVVLGSSQSMMHDLFLNGQAPLYERAGDILHVLPMSYKCFLESLNQPNPDEDSFIRYSLVGGVPKYWQYVATQKTLLELTDDLYFGTAARLEMEPDRLLRDENLVGEQAKAILELVGRGVHRPSEMAGRMNIQQTSLSKPLNALLHTSLLTREIPFGESVRSTKRTLYVVDDPCLRFWYGVYSPHRSRWRHYSADKKIMLIRNHASTVFEAEYRRRFTDARRYWEGELEFDCVRWKDDTGRRLIVSELKFNKVPRKESTRLQDDLRQRFARSQLAHKYEADCEVIDLERGLKALALSR